MKKRFIPLLALMAASMAFAAQKNSKKAADVNTARLQVIHNSADAAAKTVDVYAGNELLIDDFDFREATPYIDVDADVDIRLGFALGNSNSVNDTIAGLGQTVRFEAGKTYVAVATGNIQNTYAANPNSISTKFGVIATEGSESSVGGVGLKFLHGSADAPAVDIEAKGVSVLAPNLKFNEFSTGYGVVAEGKYVVNINVAGTSTTVVSYDVDLTGLNGGSALVFASGYLDPATNNNGEAFGVFAALPNGDVVQFPVYKPTARLQVIHNSADAAAKTVDVYAGSKLLIDDFDFREATPYIDVDADVDIRLGFALGNSNSVNDTIAGLGQTVQFEAGKTYVAVATGNIQNTYAANPNSISTKFGVIATEGSESSVGGVGLKFLHGSTDAPAVDIEAKGVSVLAPNLKFNEFSTGYGVVAAGKYVVNINVAGTSTTVVSYDVDLTGLNGGSALVFASGFLDPATNNNGEAFGVFAALPNGNVVQFPVHTATGIEDASVASINVFPNPSAETVTVNGEVNNVVVVNQVGQVVKSVNLNANKSFDVTDLNNGLYTLLLKSNAKVYSTRLSVVK